MQRWYTQKFHDKMMIYGCYKNDRFLLILKEQIPHLLDVDII